MFTFERRIASEIGGSISNLRVKPVLIYAPEVSPLKIRGWETPQTCEEELLGNKKKERRNQCALPLRFPTPGHSSLTLTPPFEQSRELPVPPAPSTVAPIKDKRNLGTCTQQNPLNTAPHTCKQPLDAQLLCRQSLMAINTSKKSATWSSHATATTQARSAVPRCRKAEQGLGKIFLCSLR